MIPTLDQLLEFASTRPDEGGRASALIDLMPRLPVDRLDAVLDVPFTDEHQRTRVMELVLTRATPAQVARIRSEVGRLTRRWPQYDLVVALLAHLGDAERAAAVESLVATLERHPDVDLSARARHLAPRLRPDQLDRLVAVGLRGEDGALFLAGMLEFLPESRLGPLVGEVCADPARLHGALGQLAARLTGEPIAALLHAARTIDDHQARCEALAALARHLPEPARTATIEASVAAAVAAMEAQIKPWARVRLDALLRQADHDQVGTLLAAERAARRRGMDSNFAAIVPFAAPAQLAEAVADGIAPTRLGEPLPATATIALTVGDLVKAIPHLPEHLQEAAVRTVLPRFDPTMYRIPHLTADQAAELLQRFDVRAEPWAVAHSLGYLAPFLDAAGLERAVAIALSIEDGAFLGETLIDIAPVLGAGDRARALQAATAIVDAGSRAYTLVRLAPLLDEPGVIQAALSAALSVPDPEDRALRLLEVAALLPADGRAAALGPAWAACAATPPGPGQGVIFETLVGLTPS